MNQLLSPQECEAIYGLTEENINVRICNHKKKYGVEPEWIVYKNGKRKICTKTFFRYKHIEIKAWQHITNELYWWLTHEPFKFTDMWLAERMANRSSVYETAASWREFFSYALFNLNEERVSPKWSRTLDFLVHGTNLMRFLIEEAKHGRYYDGKTR